MDRPGCCYVHAISFILESLRLMYMSVHVLLLLSCVHSLGLGLDLENSLDRREGENACALIRVLQPPHKFENFTLANSILAQVGGFAQKSFWSSFIKICQCLGVTQRHQNFGHFKKNFVYFECFRTKIEPVIISSVFMLLLST